MEQHIDSSILKKARRHWDSLMERLADPHQKVRVFNVLAARYGEPHRFYHTLEHVVSMLDELGSIPQELHENRTSLEIAIWAHDAHYDVGSAENPHITDNEIRSAKLGALICRTLGNPANRHVETVRQLVVCTDHKTPPATKDAKLIVDLDLAIFGKPEEEFMRYEHAIRKEYAWVPEDRYRETRTMILRKFANRQSIYHTEFFRDIYEQQARSNLLKSIETLSR